MNSKQQQRRNNQHSNEHSQHFIEGIGDGKLFADFDLPDPKRNQYIRKRVHDRKRSGELTFRPPPPAMPDMDADDADWEPDVIPKGRHGAYHTHHGHDDDNTRRIRADALPEGYISSINGVPYGPSVGGMQSSIDFPLMVLLGMLVIFLAFTFASDHGRLRSYQRKSDRKIIRSESQLIKQKKKTDEWDDLDEGYCYSQPSQSNDETDMDIDISSPRRSSSAFYSGGLYRSESARQRNIAVDASNQPRQTHSDRQMHEYEYDHSQNVRRRSVHNMDEESPPYIANRSTRNMFGDETPSIQNKQPIYVKTFSELTMPDISIRGSLSDDSTSLSVSDGNVSLLERGFECSSPHEHEHADSGETEGANGLLHKRKNLTAASDAASSLHSPIDFNELKMNRLIGGGGFGQVWSAIWRGTPVAVKLLSASSEAESVQKAILQEFVAEINMLSGMRHPNVCLYIGACLEPSNRAIVTELAGNGSLWDALRMPLKAPFVTFEGHQPVWPPELYYVAEQVGPRSLIVPPPGTWAWVLVKRVAEGAARGMNYLHCGKPAVLHRDLKSANILLDDSYNPKVCDFGLSRIKAHENSMTANCGTVQWMAPEILANEPYAEPADVYSYGIILWELLTRKCPYEGMSSIQAAMAVLNQDLRPEIPNWCPTAFADLVRQCIEKEPSNRPTFTAILSMLDSMP